MKKNLVWAVITAALALIQTTWLEAVNVRGVHPDLVLLLVIYFAIYEGEERAMFTGLIGGIFQDVASDSVLGHHVLCYVVVGFIAARVAVRLITEHPAVKVGLVFCAGLAAGLLFTIIQAVQDPQQGALGDIFSRVVPGTFYTAIVTPIVFIIVDRAFRRFFSPQGG